MGSAIVPARALAHISKILGRKPSGVVSIAGGDSEVRFVLPDGLEIRSRIIEGEFPNYRQLVPERGIGTVVRYELAEFAGALKSATPYCRDTTPVRLAVDEAGAVTLSASSPDLGSWAGTLERVTVHGPGVSVVFNPAYLAGVLEAAGDGGALEIRDGLKPATAWAADGLTVGLVMPVRQPTPMEHERPVEPEPETAPEVEPEPEDDDGRAGEPEPGPFTAPEVEVSDRFGREVYHGPASGPVPDVDAGEGAEVERMRAELEAITAELARVKSSETVPAAEPERGFDDWAELGNVGEVGPVRVRLVGGPDGRPMIDARVFGGRRGYTGRTKAGFRLGSVDMTTLAGILADGAAQAEALERA